MRSRLHSPALNAFEIEGSRDLLTVEEVLHDEQIHLHGLVLVPTVLVSLAETDLVASKDLSQQCWTLCDNCVR